jgi:hypothetical protein
MAWCLSCKIGKLDIFVIATINVSSSNRGHGEEQKKRTTETRSGSVVNCECIFCGFAPWWRHSPVNGHQFRLDQSLWEKISICFKWLLVLQGKGPPVTWHGDHSKYLWKQSFLLYIYHFSGQFHLHLTWSACERKIARKISDTMQFCHFFVQDLAVIPDRTAVCRQVKPAWSYEIISIVSC